MEITSVAVRCILAIGPVTMSDLTDQTILNRYRVETKDVATSCENSDALLLHRQFLLYDALTRLRDGVTCRDRECFA